MPVCSWGVLDAQGSTWHDPTFPRLSTFDEVCEPTAGYETSGIDRDGWKAPFVAARAKRETVLPSKGAPQGSSTGGSTVCSRCAAIGVTIGVIADLGDPDVDGVADRHAVPSVRREPRFG